MNQDQRAVCERCRRPMADADQKRAARLCLQCRRLQDARERRQQRENARR